MTVRLNTELLKTKLQESGFTQKELAKMIQCNEGTLKSLFDHSRASCSLFVLYGLSRAFHTTMEDLLVVEGKDIIG